MANVSLKTDFKNGQFLYDVDLNNNFKAIQEALKTMNQIVWGDGTEAVTTFRGTTEEIATRRIINGQLLYNVETGETYIDYEGKRVSTGSGNVIYIGEEEPTNEATKMWIEEDTIDTHGTEVVDSLEGNQKFMAPSVNAVKKANSYSTEEHFTGELWIDGSKIYEKVIDFGTMPEAETTKNVAHNIENLGTIISIKGIMTNNEQVVPIPTASYAGTIFSCNINANATDVIIGAGTDRTSYVAYVFIKYTKNEEVA